MPYVHILAKAAQVQQVWDEMLRGAKSELVMFTRPPYLSTEVNPLVIATLARGVRARVLDQADSVDDPGAQTWLRAYHQAGVEAGAVEELEPFGRGVACRHLVRGRGRGPKTPREGGPPQDNLSQGAVSLRTYVWLCRVAGVAAGHRGLRHRLRRFGVEPGAGLHGGA